jgi:hypothetical protein
LAEQGAAPALSPRKRKSGRPRATVRPDYAGLPLIGLVGTGGSGAKAFAIPEVEDPPIRS